ncbi:MAG: SHOCT domain-containing protein [Anaerolineae bacterium]
MMLGVVELLILLIVLAGIAVVVIGAVVVIVAARSRRAVTPQGPLQIAAERYARGEIDRDQFEQIKRDLSA